MPMQLLIDEEGRAVVRSGKPVYVDDEGKETEVDVPRLFSGVNSLTAESKKRREENDRLKTRLSAFSDLGDDVDLTEWRNTANEALETVANLKDKELVDAGKVKEIKDAMTTAHESEKKKLKEIYENKEQEFSGVVNKKNTQIRTLLISNQFATSKFFTGNDSVTLLPPDVAESRFGGHFQIEENAETGELSVVGYYDRAGKEMIYGSANPGGPATFDEAIGALIERYPDKDRITRAGLSGSGHEKENGSQRNNGGDTDIDKLKARHKQLLDDKKIVEAIGVKNKIVELQRRQK